MSQPIETHPFAPFIPKDVKVLMMGSFPPTADKWAMPFFYPNFYNDMWRIMGLVFYADKTALQLPEQNRFDINNIQQLLQDKHIGMCPGVKRAIREKGNASDAHLTVVEAYDVSVILTANPSCQHLITTGGKATEVVMSQFNTADKLPKTNQSIELLQGEKQLMLHRLPSTSRAYPLNIAKKATAYQQIFQRIGIATV